MDADYTTWTSSINPSYFENRIIWITGSSSGIGKSICTELTELNQNVKLILSSRRENKLNELKNDLLNKFPSYIKEEDIFILPLDLENSEVEYYKKKYQSILKHFSVSSIDMLINNAGVSMRSTFVDFDINDGLAILQINLLSPIILTKLVLDDVANNNKNKDGFGHIINIESVISRLQVGYRTFYSCSKSGLLGFSNSLSSELNKDGNNITITEILPGPVQTNVDISAKGKYGQNHNKRDIGIQGGMTSKRCAQLICISISNQLRESWPAKGKALTALYVNYYLQAIFDKYGRAVATNRVGIDAGYILE